MHEIVGHTKNLIAPVLMNRKGMVSETIKSPNQTMGYAIFACKSGSKSSPLKGLNTVCHLGLWLASGTFHISPIESLYMKSIMCPYKCQRAFCYAPVYRKSNLVTTVPV